MSDAKHTSGPWKWVNEGDDKWLVNEAGETVLQYGGCGSHEIAVNDANRALIAAAPDLVTAAEALIAVLDASDDIGPRDFGPERVALEQAVAKARGAT